VVAAVSIAEFSSKRDRIVQKECGWMSEIDSAA
jgi:hypothetical protein